jgi:hypothetical protein
MALHQVMCVDGKTAVLNNISVNGALVTSRWLPASREVCVNMTLNQREFQLEGIIQWVRRQSTTKSYHEMGIIFPNAPEHYVATLEEMFNRK